jgi:translation initiation factor eIF-2B subunit gamma
MHPSHADGRFHALTLLGIDFGATLQIPKAVLPLGNIPMVEFALRMLEREGFDNVIVVAQETVAKALNQLMDEQKDADTENKKPMRIKLDITTIPNESDLGTADALRLIREKLHTNFMVFSCDLITDFKLHHLCDVHRVTAATATALFYKPPPKTEAELAAEKARKKAGGLMDQGMNDIIAVDPTSSRLVMFDNAADIEGDEVSVRMSLMRSHPCVDVHMDLLDAHIYIFSPLVLDILEEKKWISTIKGELMPYLVKKQFSSLSKAAGTIASITRESSTPGIEAPSADIFEGLTVESAGGLSAGRSAEKGACYSYIIKGPEADEVLCVRANTVQLYCEANRMLPPYLRRLTSTEKVTSEAPYDFIHKDAKVDAKAMVGADAMVDSQSAIGVRSSIKRSIIGKHCTIGDQVSISNSIIMDHVTIEDKCKISNAVICMNAHVITGCNLQNVRVGVRHTVASGTVAKNEDLVEDADYA